MGMSSSRTLSLLKYALPRAPGGNTLYKSYKGLPHWNYVPELFVGPSVLLSFKT